MKFNKIFTILALGQLLAFSTMAQTEIVVDSPEYFQAKANGTLDQYVLVQNLALQVQNGTATPLKKPSTNTGNPKSSDCDCYQAPDGSYTLALQPNDDGSSGVINLPFTFSFYGQNYTSLYINNNGNVTFESGMSTYSSTAFPSAGRKIIAPFWGDVDTRGGNGQVLYKVTPHAIFVNWVNVGYYNTQGDKRNTFQLILSDGTDPSIPDGNNIAFCYQDMQWTTGSASSGVNGFGGTPATAGANKGDNVGYFLIGRFDHAGNDFDGPLGANDGISYLDYRSFFFNITNINNIPPIAQGITPCDTFKVCTFGDTADFTVTFLSPELNQTTSVTYSSPLASLQELSNTSGNTATLKLRIVGNPADAGFYPVVVTATDSYTPAGVTTLTFYIKIENSAAAMNPDLSFTAACNQFPVSVLNGPYEGYLWDNGATTPTSVITQSGNYGVTVRIGNCYKRVSEYIEVPKPQPFMFDGNLFLCPGEDSTLVSVNNPNIGVMNWNTGNPQVDHGSSMWLTPGTYTIYNTDVNGFCSKDTTFIIKQAVPSQIFPDKIVCGGLSFNSVGSVVGTQASWSSPNPEISFSNVYANTPTITATQPGIYSVTLTNPCANDLHAQVIFSYQPTIFPNDTVCGGKYHVDPASVNSLDGGTWSTVAPTIISFSDNSIPAPVISSNYTPYSSQVVFTDKYCPNLKASAMIVFVQDGTPTIPALACDLESNALTVDSYQGGEWFVINHPNGATYSFENGSTATNPHIKVSEPGTYTIEYRDNFCGTKQSDIYFPPYLYTEVNDTILCAGTEYLLHCQTSPHNVTYTWSTGETGTTSIWVKEPGTYSVTIQNECYSFTDAGTVEYYVCDIEAPNIISLSSQAGNNKWFVEADGVADFNCVIVNRWGNVVYEFSSVTDSWDGKDKSGKLVEDGVYFYTIKAKVVGGNDLVKHGFIHVVH